MPKIVVAALTRQRPIMVAELIRSFSLLALPTGYEVEFLIVENDTHPNTRDIVTSFSPLQNRAKLTYALETELGIPFARNRAVKEVINMNADYMAFIDDDETVAPDWLIEIVAAFEKQDVFLIGGIVKLAKTDERLDWIETRIFNGLERFNERLIQKAINETEADRQIIATNNWFADTRLFTEHGLRFDESLRFAGGEDSQFTHDVWAKGLPTGYRATKAIVYAVMSKERLSFQHQYFDRKERTKDRFYRQQSARRFSRVRLFLSVPPKVLKLLLLILLQPFRNGRDLFDIALTAGWIAGRVTAAFGQDSRLYVNTVGY